METMSKECKNDEPEISLIEQGVNCVNLPLLPVNIHTQIQTAMKS